MRVNWFIDVHISLYIVPTIVAMITFICLYLSACTKVTLCMQGAYTYLKDYESTDAGPIYKGTVLLILAHSLKRYMMTASPASPTLYSAL